MILTGAMIPLWILPTSFGALSAGAFFLQFAAQGSGGVVSDTCLLFCLHFILMIFAIPQWT